MKVYHGGVFERKGDLQYVGGSYTEWTDRDPDKWSFFEITGDLEDLGYKEGSYNMMYAHPFLQLELALTNVIEDAQSIEMSTIGMEVGTVNLYVVRTEKQSVDKGKAVIDESEKQSAEKGKVDETDKQSVEDDEDALQTLIMEGVLDEGDIISSDDEFDEDIVTIDETDKQSVDKGKAVIDEGQGCNDEDALQTLIMEGVIDEGDIISSDDEFYEDIVNIDAAISEDEDEVPNEVHSRSPRKRTPRGLSDIEDESDSVHTQDSDSENDVERPNFPRFRRTKNMSEFNWDIGTVFATKQEFRKAVIDYSVHSGTLEICSDTLLMKFIFFISSYF